MIEQGYPLDDRGLIPAAHQPAPERTWRDDPEALKAMAELDKRWEREAARLVQQERAAVVAFLDDGTEGGEFYSNCILRCHHLRSPGESR